MPEFTPDGHYIVIDGRRRRATDPSLPEDRRQALVNELMAARRAVGAVGVPASPMPSAAPGRGRGRTLPRRAG